ncbi:hypothetical protein VTP01DRAFT_1438 [Rhizomucor pusillus]|uniref:uncharacterized protein n=1 Tax=Rhizomucor pusillus TaxID=4840 RepID=UPI0037420168
MPRESRRNDEKEVQQQEKRRVSFDLSHNVVHILPSLQQCRKEATRRNREEWERRQLNQDMLCELIVSEIVQENGCQTEDTPIAAAAPPTPLKSCLKKPAPVELQEDCPKRVKRSNSHKKKKHGKRGHGKRHISNASCISEARMPPSMPSTQQVPIH